MPNEGPLVAVAISGGVDSAVAAALLAERGYRLLGVTMRLWREGDEDASPAEAAAICRALGIPHQVVDLEDVFVERVVQPFVRAYVEGRTPNPCLACNRELKFGALLEYARGLGARYLATGHYVRLLNVASPRDGLGEWQLLTAADARKDQSYVLYALGQAELAQVLFPLGEYTKAEVGAAAVSRGLPVSARSESQDICFVRNSDYRRFLADRVPEALRPGPIVDAEGRVLGEHRGLPYYTVGQREGLGIAAARPLYVKRLDVSRNALVVGHLEALGRYELLAGEVSWVSGRPPAEDEQVRAAIRYRARRVAAQVESLPEARIRVTFREPLHGITPGQAVVLYAGERVLGGGIIEG